MNKVLKTCPTPATFPYEGVVYRVWHAQDGRWYAHIREPSGVMRIRLYAKYVYETTTKTLIPPGMTVDHLNEDKTDDRFENLQIISAAANASKSSMVGRTKSMVDLICPGCLKTFTTARRKTHLLASRRATVTCCSRRCVGLYSTLSELEKDERRNGNLVREFTSAADGLVYIQEVGCSNHPTPTTMRRGAPDSTYFDKKTPTLQHVCRSCGTQVAARSRVCRGCSSLERRGATKVKYPELCDIQTMLAELPVSTVARKIGVSDTALKKYMLRRGVDIRKQV